LQELDTKEFYDMIEYEQISQALENYQIEKAKKESK
jgi:hypothetical protein